jgi:hypothetical protein
LYGHDDLVPWIDGEKLVIGTTMTMRGLRASSPFPFPLSERNVIFIGSFANHLLAGTTHLED